MASSRLLQYGAQYPLYGVGYSHSTSNPLRTALTTLVTGPTNKLLVVDPTQQAGQDFRQIASVGIGFPATKVGWEPAGLSGYSDSGAELLATTGDVLRIWDLSKDWESNGKGFVGRNGWTEEDHVLRARSVLTNSKSPQMSLPPITSFSWNPVKPSTIVTCSIDTTATLWDINTSQALTQLIAHDRAVYDLAWLPQSPDIFVSVGADGSLRAFDLRQLEHSTILYESSHDTPLARIAFSNSEQHMLACFGMDDNKTLILDMRSPGSPVAELGGHQGALSAIGWGAPGDSPGASSGGWIASCGDDCQVLMYDLCSTLPTPRAPSRNPSSRNSYTLSPPATPSRRSTPSPAPSVDIRPVKAWTADAQVNNLAFSDAGDWLSCVSGSKLTMLRV
ncbi:putative transparent testa glabra 1 protein [Kockovaella imperatae]|uniref:Putative transparent testa glabra 1 protein n=1 Tax=Kockovaella imperatae TaxID=4999 RepID=A0A1Y1UMK8_9TREE|nr:putative transparent testa glabra 1 protein [Kockovaella imperatae]ORX39239.1 putative transparent testa glabra 1 protein [Kockovaella imperatae]